jgi:hypothetical protein
MAISQQYVDEIGAALQQNCPTASLDEAAMKDVMHKIVLYDKEIGIAPSVGIVLRWAQPHEEKLRAPIDAENAAYQAEQDRIAARKKAREYDLAPSSVNLEEIRLERKQASASQPARLPFRPRKQFTDEEIGRMDSATYAREVLGQEPPSDRLQQGSTTTTYLKPERPGTRRVRTIKFSPEELAARDSREQVIAADKDERKRLQAALRAAAKKEGR